MVAAGVPLFAIVHSAWPMHDWLHEAVEEIGAALIGICIIGRIFCTLYIGSRKNSELVCTGPYSVVRNPLYLFSVAGVAGVGLSSGSLLVGLAAGAVYFIIAHLAVRGEERRLGVKFGREYAAYLDTVPRWVPDLRLWREEGPLAVDPIQVRRRLLESAGLLLALPVVELLEQLHENGLLPTLLAIP